MTFLLEVWFVAAVVSVILLGVQFVIEQVASLYWRWHSRDLGDPVPSNARIRIEGDGNRSPHRRTQGPPSPGASKVFRLRKAERDPSRGPKPSPSDS
jgi:hypothetical protein